MKLTKHPQNYKQFILIIHLKEDGQEARDECQRIAERVSVISRIQFDVESCAGGCCRLASSIVRNKKKRLELRDKEIKI